MTNNTTVGLGINYTAQAIGDMISNNLLGAGLFCGILVIGLLALIIIKGKGGFALLLSVLTVGTVLMAQNGLLPEIFAPAVWMVLGLIWAVGMLSIFKG